MIGKMNRNILWFAAAACILIGLLLPVMAYASSLPDGEQTFSGYTFASGVGTSLDGCFTLRGYLGDSTTPSSSLQADGFGAFISDTTVVRQTAYFEIRANEALKSFLLQDASIGEYEVNTGVDPKFSDVTVIGYAGGTVVFSTIPYTSTESTIELEYPIDFSAVQNIPIDSFRVYYTKEENTSHPEFNLISFIIGEASTVPPALSSDATLKNTSIVKGRTVVSLGTPDATLDAAVAGTVTITAAQAADTTNLSPYVTLFDTTEEYVTSVKVVKYASGASTAGFETDGVYASQAIADDDFFVVKVTALDGTTVLYYRINVTVAPELIGAATVTVTVPVAGASPDSASLVEAATAHSDYTVTDLSWNEALTEGGKFKAGQAYTATVTLTSKNYKAFQPGSFTPFVAGSASVGGTATSGTGIGNTVTFTVTFPVTAAKAVTGIAVKAQPSNLVYEDGEALNLASLVVTLTYNDASTLDVVPDDFTTNSISASPADGTTMVYATHNGQKVIINCGSYTAETNALAVGLPNITAAGITGLTAPVTGSAPISVSSLISNDTGSYTVTSLTWQNGDGTAATLTGGGKFRENASYKAQIVLTSAAGNKFPASGLTPSVDAGTPQAGSVSGGNVSGNTLTFTVTFPITGAKAVTGIEVKTQPSNLVYEDGDMLNLADLVVTLTYNDASTLDVVPDDFTTNSISACPSDGTTMVYATHNGQKVIINCGSYTAETNALAVGLPNITATGITGLTAPVTGSAPIAVGSLISNDTGSYTVTSLTWQNGDGTAATLTGGGKFRENASYKAQIVLTSAAGYKFPASGLTPSADAGTPQAGLVSGGNVSGNTLTFTVTFPITGAKAVTGIEVKTQPSNLVYEDGDMLNLTGLVVTLTYSDDSVLDVALSDFTSSGITASPADGTVLSYELHDGQKVLLRCGSYTAQTNALTVIPPTPVLTAGEVNRTSDQAATMTFTSDQAGTYYFGIVADGASMPFISTAGPGSVCLNGENTISLTTLTAGDFDLYLKVKSAAGKVSEVLKMDISAYFVPVTGIANLPELAWVGTGRMLAGTVSPEDATNQTIVWSVKDAGATGAAISGSTFTATGTGTAVLTAKIEKGASSASDYTQDFVIEVRPAMVYNTIEDQPDLSTTIIAEGVMAKEARLIVKPIASGEPDRDEMEEQLTEKEPIAAYEVSIEPAAAFQPPLTLHFQVDEKYNGRTVLILHKLADGSMESYTPVVENGIAVITVWELSPFLLAVDPGTMITEQPLSATALVGDTATFHVTVEGLGSVTYRWQRRTGESAAWEDILGAAGSSYTTSSLNMSHNGYQYRVIVTDALNNTITSNAAVLTVTELPVTGDSSRPVLYSLLTVLFGAVLIMLKKRRRAA